jgi:hypothetical protein
MSDFLVVWIRPIVTLSMISVTVRTLNSHAGYRKVSLRRLPT